MIRANVQHDAILQSETDPYTYMFPVNYSGIFSCQTTFSYLSWTILSNICDDDNLFFNSIDVILFMELTYSIFPGFKTLLHRIVDKERLINEVF